MGAAGGFGVGAYLFPFVGVFWGVVLLRDMKREDRVRMFIGFTMLTLGVLGMLSLLRGNPSPLGSYGQHRHHAGYARAGGLVGAVAAYPLSQVLSDYGAFVVTAGLAALGILIFTGTSFATLHRRLLAVRVPRRSPKAVAPATAPMVSVPEPAEARAAKQRPSQRAKALLDALGLLDDVVVAPRARAAARIGIR